MLDVHQEALGELDLPVYSRDPLGLVPEAGGEVVYRALAVEDLGVGETLPAVEIGANDLGLAFSADVQKSCDEPILKGRRGCGGRCKDGGGHQGKGYRDLHLTP